MTNHSQWSIGKRLVVCFAGVILLLLGLGTYAEITIGGLGASQDLAINGLAQKVRLAGDLNTTSEQMRSSVRALVLAAYAKDTAHADQARKVYHIAANAFGEALGKARALSDGAGEQRLMDALQQYFDTIRPIVTEIEELSTEGQADAANALSNARFDSLARTADTHTDRLVDEQQSDLADASRTASVSVTQSRLVFFAFIALSLALGGVVILVIRKTNRQLNHVAHQMTLHAEQVADAASQVASSSQALAQGASEQAASLEDTSSSTEEINSMARKSGDSSRGAAEVVSRAHQNVTAANHALDQMVTAMQEIGASGSKVSKILKVIDEIAFQTNILALNAAVEAARAGESGLGFAVVANEVRNLAQRCAQAAKETAELIDESIAKSNEGGNKVAQVTGAIRAITEDSASLKALIDDVSSNSHEQSLGIEQVARSITQMERVTQKTAASAEQCATTSEELSNQAQSMKAAARDLARIVGAAPADSGRHSEN